MYFSLLPYVFVPTIVLVFVNIFLIYKLNNTSAFYRLLTWFNGYMGLHILWVVIIEEFFKDKQWLVPYLPLSVMYGPFLYFAAVTMAEKAIQRKTILLHVLPFLSFFAVSIYIALFNSRYVTAKPYSVILNVYTLLSNVCYIAWVIRLSVKYAKHYLRVRKTLLTSFIMLLIFLTLIRLIVSLASSQFQRADDMGINILRTMIYAALLGCSAIIFRYLMADIFYKLYLLREGKVAKPELKAVPEIISRSFKKYEKSMLTQKQLDEYAEMLAKLMFLHKSYLDTELSLQKLAHLMRIPGHHLTQVLSLRIKLNFYDYINGYRIEHACALLRDEPSLNLEELAVASGFNSKVSFNRNFKNRMGCTPSAYRDTIKK